jgi:histidinol-phosphate/aromatic aminotransferase/cobyric acid decarboxylase-like protein
MISSAMRSDRKAYDAFFFQHDGFRPFRSDANFVLVKMPAALEDPLQKFLTERRIAIKFFSEPEFSTCIRITIGTSEQNKRLLKALTEFLATTRRSGGA